MSEPPPVVPTSAGRCASLRGRRVIVGVPGIGFRGDLRADNAVITNGRTYVPVIGELDYYRSESQQVEVFATLVPIERVWIEEVAESAAEASPPGLDGPPICLPSAVTNACRLIGRRVILAVPDGFVRELRAVSGTYASSNNVECVRICGESEWYEWGITGRTPQTQEVSASSLWLE
jgi:hypothetical protein